MQFIFKSKKKLKRWFFLQNVLKMSCLSPILCLGDKALIGKSILDGGGGGKEGRPKVVLKVFEDSLTCSLVFVIRQ